MTADERTAQVWPTEGRPRLSVLSIRNEAARRARSRPFASLQMNRFGSCTHDATLQVLCLPNDQRPWKISR